MITQKVGLIVCNSGASNTGFLTGAIAYKVVETLGSNKVGICSLPALVNKIPRQVDIVRNLKHILIIDGCKNSCAKKIIDDLGIDYNTYVNLENDVGYKKKGPFTTFDYSNDEIDKALHFILEKVKEFEI